TLRGMIASDRQEINSLKQQIQRQNDQIEELKHGAGGDASSMSNRVASLEAEVKALQAGMAATPGAIPPPGAPADSVGEAPAPPFPSVGAPSGAPVPPAPRRPRRDRSYLAERTRSGNCGRQDFERAGREDLPRRPRRDEGRQVSARGCQVHQAAGRVPEIRAERARR